MARSDFAWIPFDEQFSSNNLSATRLFDVDGDPFGIGYLLIQARGVDLSAHQILINDRPLPSFDIPVQEGNERWTTWMDRIPHGFLQQGQNTITIEAALAVPNPAIVIDPFRVANVAVHWRESG